MVLPKETRRHLRAAAREQLLTVRSLVDAGVRWFDRRVEALEARAREQAERGKEAGEEEAGRAST